MTARLVVKRRLTVPKVEFCENGVDITALPSKWPYGNESRLGRAREIRIGTTEPSRIVEIEVELDVDREVWSFASLLSACEQSRSTVRLSQRKLGSGKVT